MLIAEYDDKERIEVISKEHYQEGYKAGVEETKKEAEKELKRRDILSVIDKILILHEFVDDNDIIKSKIDDIKDIDIDVDNIIELYEKDKLNKDEIYARLFEKECDKQSLEE